MFYFPVGGGRKTTPFNGHHDLPLLARQAGRLERVSSETGELEDLLACVIFDGVRFECIERLQTASGTHILTLSQTSGTPGPFAKDMAENLTIIVDTLDQNEILHALMDVVISQSDRFVEENFCYRGFARFSRDVDVVAISRIGAQTRQCPTRLIPDPKQAQRFLDRLKKENYEIDETRIPELSQSAYAQGLQTRLSQMGMR